MSRTCNLTTVLCVILLIHPDGADELNSNAIKFESNNGIVGGYDSIYGPKKAAQCHAVPTKRLRELNFCSRTSESRDQALHPVLSINTQILPTRSYLMYLILPESTS